MRGEEKPRGRSALRARNVRIGARRTSVKLEPAFWDALETAARREETSVNNLCTAVHERADGYGLTAAIRVFLLAYGWSGDMAAALGAVPIGGLPTTRRS
ncbi:MAG: ribbon-helix-helix domain-containing protein [Marivibrio sp.]|uniref:ribbon-helix-helix domain-containing protein n=1 Tax=Marivibrio sp. TaxID=2039719 RepID=UPI0032EB7DC6